MSHRGTRYSSLSCQVAGLSTCSDSISVFYIVYGYFLFLWMGKGGWLLHNFHPADEWKTNLMSLAILFHLLCAQHVSDINISIFRSLRLCWWITTSVLLFSVRCVLEFLLRLIFGGVSFAGWGTTTSSASTCKTMDILMSETCWAHKWNKIALVFHSSTRTSFVSVQHRALYLQTDVRSIFFWYFVDLHPNIMIVFLPTWCTNSLL